jgi:hypothetical protein
VRDSPVFGLSMQDPEPKPVITLPVGTVLQRERLLAIRVVRLQEVVYDINSVYHDGFFTGQQAAVDAI